MIAKDVMTAKVVAVGPDTTVSDIAKLLVEKRISAVPVVDAAQRVIGIVSEGDLMHRPESGTEKCRGSWWLQLFAARAEMAVEYSKAHGSLASDVMTAPVITVAQDTPVADIAEILEENHIKRVPVVRDGRLVGIVSRANLLHGLATRKRPPPVAAGDEAIREDILRALKGQEWASLTYANVTVEGGVVHLWGMAETVEQIKALEIAARETAGVKSVNNHMTTLGPYMYHGD